MGEAANWIKVAESSSNSTKLIMHLDTDSIQTTKSGGREVWAKTTFIPPMPTTDQLKQKVHIDHSLSFYLYSSDKYFCVQELIEYYTNDTRASFSFKCEPKKIPPETIAENVWKFLFK